MLSASGVERRKNVSTWRGINVSWLVRLVSVITGGVLASSSGSVVVRCSGLSVVGEGLWCDGGGGRRVLVGVESVVAVLLGCMGVGLWVVVACSWLGGVVVIRIITTGKQL